MPPSRIRGMRHRSCSLTVSLPRKKGFAEEEEHLVAATEEEDQEKGERVTIKEEETPLLFLLVACKEEGRHAYNMLPHHR